MRLRPEIVAPQPQSRHADQHAEDGGHHAGEHQRHQDGQRVQRAAQVGGVDPFEEDAAGVGAHRHKARMAQRQLAQVAGGHVQRHRQDDVDAGQGEHGGAVAVDHAALNEAGKQAEQGQHQHGIDQVPDRHGDRSAFFDHTTSPLTLSRSSCGPGCRWVSQAAPRSAPRTPRRPSRWTGPRR